MYSLPLKPCACSRRHSRAPSLSFPLLVHKQVLPKAAMPPQTMNRQHPMRIRNVELPAAPRPAALQEQADNLPRVVPSISASRFHLYGQRRDWWLSHSTLFGSVPTTLRRLPPKHCHHSQVLVRQNSLPLKLCACWRRHSRAPHPRSRPPVICSSCAAFFAGQHIFAAGRLRTAAWPGRFPMARIKVAA